MRNSILYKFTAIVLCIALLTSLSFSAVGYGNKLDKSEGLSALQKQFSRGRGPSVNTYSIDYSYFDPSDGKSDSNKYPLVIIMAGALEGAYEGKELTANEFGYWACRQYQNETYAADGMYILIARAPEERLLNWNAKALTEPLKAAIDDFAEEHTNVDTERIYAMGWCLGAKGAINLAVNYPGFLRGISLMVPPFKISESEAEKMADLPVWLMGCKNDSYALFSAYIKPSWNVLVKYASNPSEKLFTSYDTAVDTNFFISHNVWLAVSHNFDFSSLKGYSGMKTVDANGKEINTNYGFINRFTHLGVKYKFQTEESDTCDCPCHSKNPLVRLIWRFMEIITMAISGKNSHYCKCSKTHWVIA